jgi:hypothetical protein
LNSWKKQLFLVFLFSLLSLFSYKAGQVFPSPKTKVIERLAQKAPQIAAENYQKQLQIEELEATIRELEKLQEELKVDLYSKEFQLI